MRLNRIPARSWLLALYVLTIVIVAIGKAYGQRGPDNNFVIFRWSFLNLASGADMYAAQPQHHADLYKYSPSFAVLFAPFALIPFALSLALWDALNALLLFFAVDKVLPSRQAAIALALIYLELRGGRERALDLAQAAALGVAQVVAQSAYGQRPRPLAPRLTEVERAAHDAFIASELNAGAIWLKLGR